MVVLVVVVAAVVWKVRRPVVVVVVVVAASRQRMALVAVTLAVAEAAMWAVLAVASKLVEVLAVAVGASRAGEVGRGSTARRSWFDDSAHSGTLPCLRRGSSSRLVDNIRKPATSFWRVSAGSITSSM